MTILPRRDKSTFPTTEAYIEYQDARWRSVKEAMEMDTRPITETAPDDAVEPVQPTGQEYAAMSGEELRRSTATRAFLSGVFSAHDQRREGGTSPFLSGVGRDDVA